MTNYQFDIYNTVRRLLPPQYQNTFLVRWLYSLLKPVATLHQVFLLFVARITLITAYTGQVNALEKALNDEFDPPFPIFIEDGESDAEIYLYLEAEQVPGHYTYLVGESPILETYIYIESEFVGNSDFIIFVPVAWAYDAAYFRAIVARYKEAGKRYTIQTY